MSYSDFDLYDAWRVTSTGSAPVARVTGLVPGGGNVLHTSLSSNQLTGQGLYARDLTFTYKETTGSSDGGHIIRQVFVKPTAAGGILNPPPQNSAVSMRAWVRCQHFNVGYIGSDVGKISMGLTAKADVRSGAISTATGTLPNDQGPNLVAHKWGGYRLSLGNMVNNTSFFGGIQNLTEIRMQLSVFLPDGRASVNVTCSGTYTSDVWYHVRMDVTANGLSGDIITAYVETPANSGNWTQVGTISLPSSDLGYQPWGNADKRFGMYSTGFLDIGGQSYWARPGGGFFDRFQFFHDYI